MLDLGKNPPRHQQINLAISPLRQTEEVTMPNTILSKDPENQAF